MAKKPSHVPVSHREYVALASFRHALRSFQHFSAAAAEQEGLSPQQHQVLLAVKGAGLNETITIGRLAEHLFLRHHSTVGLVDRLTKKRLVKRAHAAGDRRKVYVSLTAAGAAVLDRLSASHRSELQRMGDELRSLLAALDQSATERDSQG